MYKHFVKMADEILILVLINLISKTLSATTFFSYGNINGDQNLARGDDICTQIDFNFNFNYYENGYTSCCVSTNGYISFDDVSYSISPLKKYFIAPFSHDLDATKNGTIYYRTINDSPTLNQIGKEISSSYYLSTVDFIPTNAFIVTWDSVPSYGSLYIGYVSFQAILSTDGLTSFLTIYYGKLDFNATYGYYFQYGLAADYRFYFQYGNYITSTITTISNSNPEFSSNVNVNGKWIFNISNFNSSISSSTDTTSPNSSTGMVETASSLTVEESKADFFTSTLTYQTSSKISTTTTTDTTSSTPTTPNTTSSTTTSTSTQTSTSSNTTFLSTTSSTSSTTDSTTTTPTTSYTTTSLSTTSSTTTSSTTTSTGITTVITTTSSLTVEESTIDLLTSQAIQTASKISTTTDITSIITSTSISIFTTINSAFTVEESTVDLLTSPTNTRTTIDTTDSIITSIITSTSSTRIITTTSAFTVEESTVDSLTSQTVQSSTLTNQATSSYYADLSTQQTTLVSLNTTLVNILNTNASFQVSNLNILQLLDIFTGSIDTNNCLSNCSQNGLCAFSQTDNKFVCSCYLFFAGPTCSIDTRPCSSNPCLNQGTCIQNLTNPNEFSFHCNCSSLYEGSLCEYKIDVCKNETCSGNGNCINFNNKPKCMCFSSYEGESCATMSESLKTTKKVVSVASIIAICLLVCFYLMFVLLDILRVFGIKNKVSINSLKWNKRLLHQNYDLNVKKKSKKIRKNILNAVGVA